MRTGRGHGYFAPRKPVAIDAPTQEEGCGLRNPSRVIRKKLSGVRPPGGLYGGAAPPHVVGKLSSRPAGRAFSRQMTSFQYDHSQGYPGTSRPFSTARVSADTRGRGSTTPKRPKDG